MKGKTICRYITTVIPPLPPIIEVSRASKLSKRSKILKGASTLEKGGLYNLLRFYLLLDGGTPGKSPGQEKWFFHPLRNLFFLSRTFF